MNSFDRLARDYATEHAELIALRASLLDLREFVVSRNRSADPGERHVNPVDVLNRLDEANRAAVSAHFAAFDEFVGHGAEILRLPESVA
jgi:hypothetical protein